MRQGIISFLLEVVFAVQQMQPQQITTFGSPVTCCARVSDYPHAGLRVGHVLIIIKLQNPLRDQISRLWLAAVVEIGFGLGKGEMIVVALFEQDFVVFCFVEEVVDLFVPCLADMADQFTGDGCLHDG